MATITRESLAKAIKRETGIKVCYANNIVDAVIDEIVSALVEEKRVNIRAFGKFVTKQKSERIGRNPKNKAPAQIAARKVVNLKIASKLKKQINDNISAIRDVN